MAMTLGELLDTVLARYCSECSAELPRRGDQCEACGSLPSLTRPEAEERLRADPSAFAEAERKAVLEVASAEAARFREDAEEHRRQMREAYAAADRAEHVAGLELVASEAARELEAARGAEERAAAALAAAVKAEQDSAEELADAAQAHQSAQQKAEAAHRLRQGARAEIDTQLELDAAAKVLGRHQADHGVLAAERDQARQLMAAARVRAAELQDAADRAARAVEHPGRGPMSREAVFADVFGLAARAGVGQLGDEDRLMVMGAVQMMVISLGLEQLIRSDEERRVRARDAAEGRNRPQFGKAGDGMLSAAWPIPPVPSGPDPDGHVTAPPPISMSPTAGAFGPMAAVSPGIPGAPPPTLVKTAGPFRVPVTDSLWGITGIGKG
jgi:hypothetical protein